MKRLLWLLLLSVFAFAQGYNAYQTNTFATTGAGVGIYENSTITYHQLSWTVTGTVSGCTVAVDSSPDNSTWTAGGIIAGATCTTTGSGTLTNASATYVRVHMTAFTGTGSVLVVYKGYNSNPAGGGGGFTAGGDLSGSSTSQTVIAIEGGTPPVSATVGGWNSSKQPIAANAHQVAAPFKCADTSSSATTYTCATSPVLTTPLTGDVYSFYSINQNNSGPATLAIGGGTAYTIKKWQATADLAAGDLQVGASVLLRFDGTYFELDTIGNAPSGTPAGTAGGVLSGTYPNPGAANPFPAIAYSCGTLNTTSCVITGYGSISGSATFTWPAVAGTVTNPVIMSNVLLGPAGNAGGPTYGLANGDGLFADGATFPALSINGTETFRLATTTVQFAHSLFFTDASGFNPTTGAATYLGGFGVTATAGLFTIDKAAPADNKGTLKLEGVISGGTTFTSSGGLDEGSLVGGGTAGQFTTATVTSGSTVITMGADVPAAPHGWHCTASDITHPLDIIIGTSAGTTSCTLTVAVAITLNDVIEFSAIGY